MSFINVGDQFYFELYSQNIIFFRRLYQSNLRNKKLVRENPSIINANHLP